MLDNATVRAQVGAATIDTANSNRDGSGTLVTVYTVPSDSVGAVLNSILVKAVNDTTPGMVRIFLHSATGGGLYYLLEEFSIPASTPSGVLESFQAFLQLPGAIYLNAEDAICASTEQSDTFNVTVNVLNWKY